jgi:hypothetical protein
MKHVGPVSWNIFEAVGIKIVAVEDPAALARSMRALVGEPAGNRSCCRSTNIRRRRDQAGDRVKSANTTVVLPLICSRYCPGGSVNVTMLFVVIAEPTATNVDPSMARACNATLPVPNNAEMTNE